jgi:hypothetical protein
MEYGLAFWKREMSLLATVELRWKKLKEKVFQKFDTISLKNIVEKCMDLDRQISRQGGVAEKNGTQFR